MYITGLSVVAQQVHLQLQYPIQSSGSGPGVLFCIESSLQLCNWEAAGGGLRNATPALFIPKPPLGITAGASGSWLWRCRLQQLFGELKGFEDLYLLFSPFSTMNE